MGAVAKRYARALFQVANERNQLDMIEHELHHLKDLFEENPNFLDLVNHPTIEQRKKKEALQAVFENQVSETMLTFLNILVDRDRETELGDITDSFVGLANKERNLADAHVYTSHELQEEERNQIAELFAQITGRSIRVHNYVDDTILGGVLVKIGDRIYDGSVKGKLNRFKHRVLRSKS